MLPSSVTNIHDGMIWGLDTNVGASSRKTRGYDRSLTARLKLGEEKKNQNKLQDNNIVIIIYLILPLIIYCPHPPPCPTAQILASLPFPEARITSTFAPSLLMPLHFPNYCVNFTSLLTTSKSPSNFLPSDPGIGGTCSGRACA